MTPIEQHQNELRALIESAGMVSRYRPDIDMMAGQKPGGSFDAPPLVLGEAHNTRGVYYATYGEESSALPISEAFHADPRVALQACLEMAGLLKSPAEDRINQTIVALKFAYDKARRADDTRTQGLVDGIARILMDQPAKNMEGVSFEAKLCGLEGLQTFIDAFRQSDRGKA